MKNFSTMKKITKISSTIEKTRNTSSQLEFYNDFSKFIESSEGSFFDKMRAFPVYTTRQVITRFLERYEVFKMIANNTGDIFECGVGGGLGLMAFSHFCSIFEPNHYTRNIVGFDTFEGFTGISDKDHTSSAEHLKEGGLNFGSYEQILESIRLYDRNRPIGNIEKTRVIKGDISITLPKYINEHPETIISLLYLDLDLYLPTKRTIECVWQKIPKGGIICFDELNHKDYPGETLALCETIGLENFELKRLSFSPMLTYITKE